MRTPSHRILQNDEGSEVYQGAMPEDFSATLSWRGTPEEVRILATSLRIDDPEAFVVESVMISDDSAELRLTVISGNPGRLRATMDDLMACLSAAEAMLETTYSEG